MHFREDLQGSPVSAGHGPGTARGHKDPEGYFQSTTVGRLPAGTEEIPPSEAEKSRNFDECVLLVGHSCENPPRVTSAEPLKP